ncbi:hypothetical protein ACFOUO_02835 [Salinithrix halophila]|uniref:Uncharacterized protein n=1 Tax=Salinithrix halophila TaxID=1485204 RepID=A0ABV8JA31_9BACL
MPKTAAGMPLFTLFSAMLLLGGLAYLKVSPSQTPVFPSRKTGVLFYHLAVINHWLYQPFGREY